MTGPTLADNNEKINVFEGLWSSRYPQVHSQDLLDLRARVEAFKKSAQTVLESHKIRAAKIDNTPIKKPDDIGVLLAELRALFSVFDGGQVDLANFAIYQKWRQRFDDDAGRLDDSSLTKGSTGIAAVDAGLAGATCIGSAAPGNGVDAEKHFAARVARTGD